MTGLPELGVAGRLPASAHHATGWTDLVVAPAATLPAAMVAVLVSLAAWLVLSPPAMPRRRGRSSLLRVLGAPRAWWRARGGSRPGSDDGPVRVSQLADVADLLALVFSAGCGVVEALELVGDQYPNVLGRHLRTVAAAMRWGLEEADQWAAVPREWAPIRQALRIAVESGVPPAEALTSAARDLRRTEQHRVEVAASELGAKAVLPLGLAFLPAFLLTTVVPVVLMLAGELIGR